MPLFEGTFENDQILGTSEDESLIGGAGDDTLDGGAGDDFLKGEAGNDLLEGGDGDDTIDDGIGTDTVDGGAGVDTYTRNLSNDYSDFAFNPVLDLVLGRLYSEDFEDDFDTLISIENVEALGSFHYNLIGDEFDNHLRSGLGDDTLIGGAGYDTLDGGAGDDVLQGGEGNDVIYGGAGVDIVSGGAGSDSLFGGEGEDAIIYTDSVGGVIIDVIAGFAQDGLGGRDQFQGFEAFVGSSFDDEIIGSATDGSIPFQLNAVFGDVRNYETFRGNSGDDTIDGGGGYDELNYANSPVGLLIDLSQSVQIDGFGSVDTIASIEGVEATAFDDVIYGNDADNGLDGRLGNNYIDGRDGYDFVEYNGPERAVVLNLNENKAVYTRVSNGEQYEDRLFNIEGAVGSANDDQLYGDSESNFFYGKQGDDTLAGLEGNDSLEGGYGNDVLDGGDGDDTAVYSGNQNNYSLVLTRTNTTIEDRRSDLNGIDTLSNTEFLDFVIDPTSVPFDLQIFGGSTGLAALDFESFIEFYIAYFNRAPDAVGLNF